MIWSWHYWTNLFSTEFHGNQLQGNVGFNLKMAQTSEHCSGEKNLIYICCFCCIKTQNSIFNNRVFFLLQKKKQNAQRMSCTNKCRDKCTKYIKSLAILFFRHQSNFKSRKNQVIPASKMLNVHNIWSTIITCNCICQNFKFVILSLV